MPPSRDHHHHRSPTPPPPHRVLTQSHHHLPASAEYPVMRGPRSRRPRCCAACCTCFAWALALAFLLASAAALCGALLYAWFRPELPVLRVERLNVTRLDLTTGLYRQPYLDADVDMLVEALNRNPEIGFAYDGVEVRVRSGAVGLGRTSVPAFSQGGDIVTVVGVRTAVSNALVDAVEGEELRKKFKQGGLVAGVEFSCSVRAVVRGWRSASWPVMWTCEGIVLSRVAEGVEPQCKADLFGRP